MLQVGMCRVCGTSAHKLVTNVSPSRQCSNAAATASDHRRQRELEHDQITACLNASVLHAASTIIEPGLGHGGGGDTRLVTHVFGPLRITPESVRCESGSRVAPQAHNLQEAN